ncbi:hypothetical protein NKG94_14045 [Micromonospora sp. M12]
MTGATHRRDRPDPLDDDLGWMLGIVFRGYVRAAEHVLVDFPAARAATSCSPRRSTVRPATRARSPRSSASTAPSSRT